MEDSTTSLPNGERICDADGCVQKHYALGLCQRHYRQHQYWADPETYRQRRRDRYARSKVAS